MDKKLKAKWVKALRSGKYRQGKSKLYKNSAYCCLGVLCQVKGAVLKRGKLLINGKDVRLPDRHGGYEEFVSPKIAGLRKPTQERLANLNDGFVVGNIKRHSFKEIADYIERRL